MSDLRAEAERLWQSGDDEYGPSIAAIEAALLAAERRGEAKVRGTILSLRNMVDGLLTGGDTALLAAVAAERERCAKVAERAVDDGAVTPGEVAAAIRAGDGKERG